MQGNFFGRNLMGGLGSQTENRVMTEYDKIPAERVKRGRTGWLLILIGIPLFLFLMGILGGFQN
jgi:hypothetical protein